MIARIARRPGSLALRKICAVLALALLASCLSGCMDDAPAAPATPRARPTAAPADDSESTPAADAEPRADWTVLVYLDGDNDLESDAITDYNEMASVGSNERLNIIVQFDRVSSVEDWDDSSNGDWRGVKRFRVAQRKRPVKSNQIADMGELNMGDPRTLVDFVSWGIKSYPARRYALIFWDHGASWPGVASDDSSDGDMLTLPEIGRALADVRKRTGVQKLDLIGFDACLMGQIDVLQAVAPFGQVAIGSADLEPGEGWAWNAWLGDLTRKPPQDAVALAPSIIKSFDAFYKKEDDPSVTLAAFDLTKIDQMTAQLDDLASAMIDSMPDAYAAIGKARSFAAEYAEGDTDISAIDLGYFADSLIAAGADDPVADAARALSRTIKSARISQGYGADHPKSTGISVYFPKKKKHYDGDYADASPLTKATRWDEFLQAFYSAGKGHSARASTTKPKLNKPSARPDAPLTMQARITGSDTAYVYYFIGQVAPSDSDTLQIMTMDYLYPPGAPRGDADPAWSEGDSVQLAWQSSIWYVGNGSDATPVSFVPSDYGTNAYNVDGAYVSRRTRKRTPVTLEFAVDEGRAELQHIWAFDKGDGDNPRPRELKPKAGDSFAPDLLIYNAAADEIEERAGAGQPITFGDDPLSAFQRPAPAGKYVIGLMVENLAGDISDQYADVTVGGSAHR